MTTGPDLFTMIRSALSASTTATDPTIRGFYLSLARTGYAKAAEEMHAIEGVLVAHENEAARVAAPKQIAKPGSKP